ncbi:MAG: Smr/MutS family protein [Oceanospirillaceae bacterium]|nr:Smr/MutS family protein [Oceanospirillaceae bacterium]
MPDFETPAYLDILFDAKPTTSDDEHDSFASAVGDIRPIPQEKANIRTKSSIKKRSDKSYHRQQATLDSISTADGLSTESVNIVDSDQALLFASQGIQPKLLKRLQKGHIPWEQGIDLHGFTIDQARDQLSEFIQSCYHKHCHVALVIHGKAYSHTGSLPMLKSYCNDWLRQLPQVLAFCSAQAKDGGTGALYVLLRRKKQQH